MLVVPALKVQQFSREFFLLNLAAEDAERLVRFEVLGAAPTQGAPARAKGRAPLVNWAEIERKVEASEEAYQRPILKRKIEELAAHYVQCREDGEVPAIPGAVLLTTDEPVEFTAQDGNPFVGLLRLGANEGGLRVLDGQHRLLALAALLGSTQLSETQRAAARALQVPAVLFVRLPAPTVVEMFVTINSKHTKLNPSLLFSLKGKQLYADPVDARIHDVVKKLNEEPTSPLEGHIKLLGVGPGKVAQAGLAQELRKAFEVLGQGNPPWLEELHKNAPKLYLAYFKDVARAFDDAWVSKKHSARSLIALRAFVQASIPVVREVFARGGDPRVVLHEALADWAEKVGSRRFETAAGWRERAAGGGKETTRVLARELIAALRLPAAAEKGAS